MDALATAHRLTSNGSARRQHGSARFTAACKESGEWNTPLAGVKPPAARAAMPRHAAQAAHQQIGQPAGQRWHHVQCETTGTAQVACFDVNSAIDLQLRSIAKRKGASLLFVRSFFLFLSRRKWLRRWLETSSMARGLSRRFVAGETLDQALAVSRKLNDEGITVTLDHLGESVTSLAEA
ncbi:MAG TPA: hypothetical protein VGS58_18235, partial [Candidatus Sulfopaludibacter sp.]|nr:hypothetical protein [Candidatus Sulfopaludibacter sp.]